MSYRPFTWCVLAVSFCSCASEGDRFLDTVYEPCRPLIVEAAEDASPEELSSVENAIEMWNSVSETRLATQGPPGTKRLPVCFEKAAPIFRGIYEDEIGVVFINRRLQDSTQRTITIAHELGHAFGLWHVPRDDGPSVMHDGNLELPPTPGDARRLQMLWPSCVP